MSHDSITGLVRRIRPRRGTRATLPLVAITVALTVWSVPQILADDMVRLVHHVGQFPVFEYQSVEILGDQAIVFGVGGFQIVELAGHTDVGHFEYPLVRLFRGAVTETHVYAGAREDGLFVVDVTDATEPQLATVHGLDVASYEGAAVHAGYLYAARHGDGLEIFDLTDPADPQPVATLPGLENSWDVAGRGSFVLVADGGGGLAVVNVADPALADHLYSLPTTGAAVDVAVADDLAVVALGSAGVDIFDVSDPPQVQWLGNYDSSGLAMSVAVVGDTLYIADWDDIEVVDLSIPQSPSRMGWERTPTLAMGLTARGEQIHVAEWGRMATYVFGPTVEGDIDLPLPHLGFGAVPVGQSAEMDFSVINTGGGSLEVFDVRTYNEAFTVAPPTSFTVPPGSSHDVTVVFTPDQPGYDATFVRIESDDPDEAAQTFPVTADDDPDAVDVGDEAPGFTYTDLDGASHSLSDYLGQVVVLAFFSNW